MISKNIRYLRRQENISQEEFAERFGVSRQSVAKWESGESAPDIFKCRDIADYYDISIDVLIGLPLEDQEVREESSDGKYIFGMVKVGDRGQIVIPKYAREVFDIKAGDRLMVMGDTEKGGIALAKVSLGNFFGKKGDK
ncbi:MAG: helix-turn-helix domain-containing protein [Ruminococcus sp.]|nr:helix-turn-helix domain-containing protein [Ruminococcus sp.]